MFIVFLASQATWLVDGPGLLLMLLAWFLWIAIWDSRKKWPGLPFEHRVIKLITFQR